MMIYTTFPYTVFYNSHLILTNLRSHYHYAHTKTEEIEIWRNSLIWPGLQSK